MSELIDLTGQRFGKLLVIKKVDKPKNLKNTSAYWLCKCDCGNERIVLGYKLRHGLAVSCSCYNKERRNKRAKEIGDSLKSIYRKEKNTNTIFKSYKANSKRRGLEFCLTKEYFLELINKNCFYCGSPIMINGTINYNGIDRVSNMKGYTLDNSVSCCKVCNVAKHAMSKEEFLEWIEKVYNYSVKNKIL